MLPTPTFDKEPQKKGQKARMRSLSLGCSRFIPPIWHPLRCIRRSGRS